MVDLNRTIFNAIDCCITENSSSKSQTEVINGLKSDDCILNSKFRIFIARDVIDYLKEIYGNVIKASRLYGSSAGYSACTTSDIDIVILVTGMPESFNKLIADMNDLLSGIYYSLIGEEKNEWNYLLDIHVINEDPHVQVHPSRAYLEYIFINDSIAV